VVGNGILHTIVLAEVSRDGDHLAIFLFLCLLGVGALAIPGRATPGITGERLLHTEAVVGILCQFALAVTRLQNELGKGYRCKNTTLFLIGSEQRSHPRNHICLREILERRCLSTESLRNRRCRRSVHLCFDCLTEGIHGIAHLKTFPKMLRITMVGSHTLGMTFSVRNDVGERLQTVLLAEHGKEFYRDIISTLCHSPRGRSIGTDKRCTPGILDAGRFTHFHTNVGVVCVTASVPATMIPRQSLIDSAFISINETVNTGIVVGCTVPGINKDCCIRLGTSNRMQHQSFDGNLSSCRVAGVFLQNAFYEFHITHHLPSPSGHGAAPKPP